MIRRELGFALYPGQTGQQHETAKILSHKSEILYVLHAFQKKSTSGISTPRRELELIRRLLLARKLAAKRGDGNMTKRALMTSSGNVFADLNLPQPDELLAKAELAAKIIAEIQRRRLTQNQAAVILGIDQPKVSALKQGKLSAFSIERLMRLLLRLGRDIEITVRARPISASVSRLRVA